MPRNNLPKTVSVTLDGVTLTINQNGRIVKAARLMAATEALVEKGLLRREQGMLFVSLDTLAAAYGLTNGLA